jgi:hypothetical protein
LDASRPTLTEASLSSLLLDLYACARDAGQCPRFLGQLCALVGAPQAALVHNQVVNAQFVVASVTYGVDSDAMAAYLGRYAALDPWAAAFEKRGGFARWQQGQRAHEPCVIALPTNKTLTLSPVLSPGPRNQYQIVARVTDPGAETAGLQPPSHLTG